MSKAIAIAVYKTEGDDLYSKELFTEDEVQMVADGEDDDVQEWKSIIVRGDNLSVEDHT